MDPQLMPGRWAHANRQVLLEAVSGLPGKHIVTFMQDADGDVFATITPAQPRASQRFLVNSSEEGRFMITDRQTGTMQEGRTMAEVADLLRNMFSQGHA
jgi:hypothetical protein